MLQPRRWFRLAAIGNRARLLAPVRERGRCHDSYRNAENRWQFLVSVRFEILCAFAAFWCPSTIGDLLILLDGAPPCASVRERSSD
jgi:hypothetical protein